MDYLNLYIGCGMLWVTMLALNVSRVRIAEQVGNGDGGIKRLRRAIRAHMNAVEHCLPYGLIVFGLSHARWVGLVLGIFVIGFLVTRLANGLAMLFGWFRIRQLTALFTYLFEVVGCVLILVRLV